MDLVKQKSLHHAFRVQMGIEDPGANTGICGWGYSCAYSNSISWAAPNKPLPHEINPQVVFEKLFGDGATPEERLARKQQSGSVLDAVNQKLAKFQSKLPSADKNKMNDYLEAIRELERRLQLAAQRSTEAPSIEVPFGVPESFDEHIKLMLWISPKVTCDSGYAPSELIGSGAGAVINFANAVAVALSWTICQSITTLS